MKLAGLDLYEISSGRYEGKRHIFKRGRSLFNREKISVSDSPVSSLRCYADCYPIWRLPSIGIPLIQQIALRNHGLHVKKVRKLQKTIS